MKIRGIKNQIIMDSQQYELALNIRYFIQKRYNVIISQYSETWLIIIDIAKSCIAGKIDFNSIDIGEIHKELTISQLKEIIVNALNKQLRKEQNQEKVYYEMEQYKNRYDADTIAKKGIYLDA